MCSFGQRPTKLFVSGGQTVDGEWTKSVEIYDPQKRGWFMATPSVHCRYAGSCCPWGGGIVVVGGRDEMGTERGSRHCELYDPLRDEWRSLKDLHFEHGEFPAVWCDADDEGLYVASHFVDGGVVRYRVEMLDAADHLWTVVESKGVFRVEDTEKILKDAERLKVLPVRVCCGVSIKMVSKE